MPLFQTKIAWKMPRKSEYKNYRSVPTRREIENSTKIAKRFKKLKKYHYGLISSQNRLENDEKERK